jgi:hypothetical protein
LKHRSFKFGACWNIDVECAEVIKSVWSSDVGESNAISETRVKLERCKQALTEWSASKFGSIG